jgi:hypothetical protein
MAKKHMKKCSTFPTIKKTQIIIMLRFYLTPVRIAVIENTTNVGKNVGKREPSYAVGGNVN